VYNEIHVKAVAENLRHALLQDVLGSLQGKLGRGKSKTFEHA
jgi:hypothetical protein